MRYNYLLLIFYIITPTKAMELPLQSMLIFFGLDNRMDRDIPQEIKQYIGARVIDKKEWWYLDREFQYTICLDSVCFNHIGNLLATASRKKALIFDITTNQEVASFKHSRLVRLADFNYADDQLVTVADDKIVRIFDLITKKEITSFQHKNYVDSVCFSPNGNKLATGSYKEATIFDLTTKQKVISFPHNDWVNSVCFNLIDNQLQLATASNDKNNKMAYVFDCIANTKTASFPHEDNVNSVRLSPNDNNQLATASSDSSVRIFDLITNKEVVVLQHNHCVNGVCFNPHGSQLATASDDIYGSLFFPILSKAPSKIRIFTLTTNQEVASFQHNDYVHSMSFSHNQLATASYDKIVRIFTRYTTWTFKQSLLKKITTLWLCVEKPSRDITSVELLFKTLQSKFGLDYQELCDIWKTFPENMQLALWRTIDYKIKKYGKEKSIIDHIYDSFMSFTALKSADMV